MSQRSANFAAFPVLAQDSQGPQEVTWAESPSIGQILVHKAADKNVDLWVLPLADAPAERKPTAYLQTQFSERQGRFSPDGHWIAYASNESGPDQYEIYVQSFPAGSGKFMLSTRGGTQPRWRRDGKELFYISGDGKVMAVDVKTSPKFEAGVPKVLFDPRIVNVAPFAYIRYAVTPDGKRFLVNSFAGDAESSRSAPITVVLNWQAAVKR